MKTLVVLGIISLGVSVAFIANVGDQLLLFVLAGHIPLTKLSVPPMLMLALWVLVLPVAIFGYQASSKVFWKVIEIIGEASQRRINRKIRWGIQREVFSHLHVIYLLEVAKNIPKSTIETPSLEFRRRFLALPS